MTKQKNPAFTLVEWLVVIGIMSALLALILPVVGRARESGRKTVCASNLHQLGMAAMMYAQDNDSQFPPFRNTDAGSDCDHTGGIAKGAAYCDPPLLHAALVPYVGGSGIWFCPDDPVSGRASNAWFIDHRFSSYTYAFFRNYRLSLDGLLSTDGNLKLSASETRLIYDPNWGLTPGGVNNWPTGGNHFDGVNICYADGHVKWTNRKH